MYRLLTALASGVLLGLGLAISGLLNPAKVQAFLDITGAWDPSLVLVLAAGVAVTMIGYRLVRSLGRPLFDTEIHLPTKTKIDAPLIAGSAIFGVGWGLAGLCPGPAITALSLGLVPATIFTAAMLAGMVVHDRFVAPKG